MEQKRQSWKQLKKISSKGLLNALREREEDGKSDNQSSSDSLSSESEDDSEEEDRVLASPEEEEESTEKEEMIESTENLNVNATIVHTWSGRRVTRIQPTYFLYHACRRTRGDGGGGGGGRQKSC